MNYLMSLKLTSYLVNGTLGRHCLLQPRNYLDSNYLLTDYRQSSIILHFDITLIKIQKATSSTYDIIMHGSEQIVLLMDNGFSLNYS